MAVPILAAVKGFPEPYKAAASRTRKLWRGAICNRMRGGGTRKRCNFHKIVIKLTGVLAGGLIYKEKQ
jgi:hypothetical protein